MRRLALLLAALPLLLAGLVSPAQAADAATTYSAKAHAATNKARAKDGLAKLRRSSCLQTYAARQAAALAATNDGNLVHQDLGPILSGCGLSTAGENLGLGFPNGKAMVRGWLRSPGHRANILRGSFRSEAIAAVRAADGRWYVAQVFGG